MRARPGNLAKLVYVFETFSEIIYLFSVDLNVSHVILEHGGHVDFWELVFTKDNEKTSFSTGTVTNDDQLLADGRHGYKLRSSAIEKNLSINDEASLFFQLSFRLITN